MLPAVWTGVCLFIMLLKHHKLHGVMIVMVVVLTLSQPALLPCCFLIIAIRLNRIKSIFKAASGYYSGYIAGLMIIYLLNSHYFDFFGIKYPAFLHPHPLHCMADMMINLQKLLLSYASMLQYYKYILAFSILGLITLALVNKKACLNIITALVIILIPELVLQLCTGTNNEMNTTLWTWFMFISITALLVNQLDTSSLITSKIIVLLPALLIAICGLAQGANNWIRLFTYNTQLAEYQNFVGINIRNQQNTAVYFCGKPAVTQAASVKQLSLAVWAKYNVELRPLATDKCDRLRLPNGLSTTDKFAYFRVN